LAKNAGRLPKAIFRLLNATDKDAHVKIMIYFSDRDPAGPYEVVMGARSIYGLMISMIQSQFRMAGIIPASSNPMFRLLCSIRGSMAVKVVLPCCRRLPIANHEDKNGVCHWRICGSWPGDYGAQSFRRAVRKARS
jgi:hypothetical protein